MPFDFMSMINDKNLDKKIDPTEIYKELDRQSITGDLRSLQYDVLKSWFNERRDDKDIIIKLNTGVGKTLIGLLMLQSKINENNDRCVYICPNKYLARQVMLEADKFGIRYCQINDDNNLPSEFFNGEEILITYVQKVFNGKSIFGLKEDYKNIDVIILDDSHACIDSIQNNYILSIYREDNEILFSELISLFKNSLKQQGEGTFLDIIDNHTKDFIQIPYWDWIDKSSDVTKLLKENRNSNNIVFKWDILKNNIDKCVAFLSSEKIEITPSYIDINMFKSFSSAKNRILMSATTQDDSFFINGLGLNKESIINPLTTDKKEWFGEKMILIPSLLDEGYSRRNFLSSLNISKDLNYGVVALTPSFNISEIYAKQNFKQVTTHNISETIDQLKKIPIIENQVVFANRYDGIDLPDNACRILIFDSLPYLNNLYEKYEYLNRDKNSYIMRKIAQKIEQGFGRGVRGDKDFCVILLFGEDLVHFVQTNENKELLSEQSRIQIDMAFEMSKKLKEEKQKNIGNNSSTVNNVNTIELLNKFLNRDEGWKRYYKARMNENFDKNSNQNNSYSYLEILELEMKAEKNYYFDFYDEAIKYIDQLIDKCTSTEDKAWYLEKKARYMYGKDKHMSNSIQVKSFKLNNLMLRPVEGISYKKLDYLNENRIQKIKDYITKHGDYENFKIKMDLILNNLSFGVDSNTFESALDDIGKFLGFETQRPDKLLRKGPDNLWSLSSNQYIYFECKNQVQKTRKCISKSEAGQMNNHAGWFDENYTNSDVVRVIIIPTNILSKNANFTHDTKVINLPRLERFKSNLLSFIKSLQDYDLNGITLETLNKKIIHEKLTIEDIRNEYVIDYEKEN